MDREMNARENLENLSPQLASRLGVMIEASLLTYREYIPWADALIAELSLAPGWLCDLAVTKYRPRAAELVNKFANSDSSCGMSLDDRTDEYVACLCLRYERRELSWATFLELAGNQADASGGKHACEFFDGLLNQYKESRFAEAVEHQQRERVFPDYRELVESV
jgi:hypothetical protein